MKRKLMKEETIKDQKYIFYHLLNFKPKNQNIRERIKENKEEIQIRSH